MDDKSIISICYKGGLNTIYHFPLDNKLQAKGG